MDAFYPSVEQRDNPALKGLPVIVAGPPDSRSVVASCSYEARSFGVHSAMSSAKAYRLCPEGIFIKPRPDVYRKVSDSIMKIFREYSELVEAVSIDEAYIDVTSNIKGLPSATETARRIRTEILDRTGLTASAGVSYNKFLAKTASGYNKPDGLTVITPAMSSGFLEALPIGRFYGIGKATEKKFLAIGVNTGKDLKKLSREELVSGFGKAGNFYYDIVRGVDERPVVPFHERQSMGREETFPEDLFRRHDMLNVLMKLATEVASMLKNNRLEGRTLTLKAKYPDFISVTRSLSLEEPVSTAEEIMEYVPYLLDKTCAETKKVRLLGISVSTLSGFSGKNKAEQLILPF